MSLLERLAYAPKWSRPIIGLVAVALFTVSAPIWIPLRLGYVAHDYLFRAPLRGQKPKPPPPFAVARQTNKTA